jgi:signal transduction histidine kinase
VIQIKLQRKGSEVIVEITDNGVGMDRVTLTKAVEAGFSTKQGSGLGLSAAYSIVVSHGGKLTLNSEPGRGTTCRIELPALEANHS